MKTLSTEKIAVVLDLVYYNATHCNQIGLTELAKKAKVSYNPFRAIIKHLQDLNLLFIEGSNRKPTFRWNKEKAGVNTAMVRKIYELYTNKPHTPSKKEPKIKYTLDKCIEYLQSRGWSGTLTRVKESGLIKTIEEVEI